MNNGIDRQSKSVLKDIGSNLIEKNRFDDQMYCESMNNYISRNRLNAHPPATTSPGMDGFIKLLFAIYSYPKYRWDRFARRMRSSNKEVYYFFNEKGDIESGESPDRDMVNARNEAMRIVLRNQFLIRKYNKIDVPFYEVYETMDEKYLAEKTVYNTLDRSILFLAFLSIFVSIPYPAAGDVLNTMLLSLPFLYLLVLIVGALIAPLASYKAKTGLLRKEITRLKVDEEDAA